MIHIVKSNKSQNWGDKFGPVLVEKITGKTVKFHVGVSKPKCVSFLVCGSHLVRADESTEVWGAGFISEKFKTDGEPRKVHCVRGPRSDKWGVGRYGDPGLLAKTYFPPKTKKSVYRLGVIHHYRASRRPLPNMGDEVLEIDIRAGIQRVVNLINLCECIASESLHGLIVADSLGIPSTWIPTHPEWKACWFKFHDYFDSVGRTQKVPMANWWVSPETVISTAETGQIGDRIRDLKETCPFG